MWSTYNKKKKQYIINFYQKNIKKQNTQKANIINRG